MVEMFRVAGMSCDHCVRAITQEFLALDGVRNVSVDLVEGTVAVTCDHSLPANAVAAAVEEAGFELTP
jgi:copper chaperone CopZ